MKRVKLGSKIRKTLRGSSRGLTLIEVLVALALFGIIAITFAGGLGTASRATFTADIRTNAESLARTQMEHIKAYNYTAAPDGGVATYPKVAIPEGYAICSVNSSGNVTETVNCGNSDPIIAVPWDSNDDKPIDTDNKLQKIILVIRHEGRYVMTLEGYKVNR